MHDRSPIADPVHDAARIVARLVPGMYDAPTDAVVTLTPAGYSRLSTGERAAADLALDLWEGGGPVARLAAFADAPTANAVLTAVHVALGPLLVPLGRR
jgi:hypothetical protein